MKKKTGKLCYFCESAATSSEHIPPKQMFKGFDCDSLVVPSCDDHNQKKSSRDQAIIYALLANIYLGSKGNVKPEIIPSINFAIPSFDRVKRLAVRSPIINDPPPELEELPELIHLRSAALLTTWIRQLTAGIMYSGIGEDSRSINWADAHVWSPNWFPIEKPIPFNLSEYNQIRKGNKKLLRIFEGLPWRLGWSSSPRPYPSCIYSFMVVVHSGELITIRHKFYEQYNWYVTFEGTNKSIESLLEKTLKS